jgi:methyltransferase
MDLSVILFLCLLVAVASLRLVELRISKNHQKEMASRGAAKVDEPRFRWMVLLHTAVLIGAAVEVVFLKRPFLPWLAAPMFAVFLAANAVRWWVIRSLGEHWNVQVVDSTRLGVVTSGPFRYVRHPNYAAVFTEMLALPLIHTAWITALAGTLAHIGVLAQRLSTEERVLFANPDYRAAMTGKPRFLPGLF